MEKTLILCLIFMLFGNPAFAQFFKNVEVIKISNNQKSVILDIGASEDIGENDLGKIYDFVDGDLIQVAELEAVKSNNTYSFWLIRKINPKKKIELEKKYQFEYVSSSLRNRSPEIIKYKNSVEAKKRKSHSGISSDYIPEDLIFEEELFGEGDKIVKTKPTKKQTIEMESKTKFIGKQKEYVKEYDKEVQILRPENLEQLVELKDVRKEEREKLFKKQVEGFTYDFNKKSKGLAYGLDISPDDNKSHMYSRYVGISISNTMDKMKLEEERNSVLDQKAVRRIKKEGPMWSKGMTEKELRKYLIESGIAKEKLIRERALHEIHDNEIFLKYSTSLNSYANTADPNFQGNNFSFTFGYEYALGRSSEYLKNFTVEGHFETGVNFVDLSTTNARVQYSLFGGTVNWYFWNKPYSVRKYMLFVGTGFERGGGNLQTGQFESRYAYDLTTVPVNIGVKYRFRAGDERGNKGHLGLGLFFIYGYRYTEYSTDEFVSEFFDPNVVTKEDRLSIGMSAYF